MTTLSRNKTGRTERDGAPANVWKIVAEREISSRLREKSFKIGVTVMVAAIIGSIVFFSILGGRPTTYDVAVTDSSGTAVVQAASKNVDSLQSGSRAVATTYASVGAAEQAVRDKDVDAALIRTAGRFEIIGNDSVEPPLTSALSAAAGNAVLTTNASKQNIDLNALRKGSEVKQRLLNPDADLTGGRAVVAFYFVLIFYLTAIIFGMIIAQSITQEKESRVVEILAAAIPIRALLWGKILGNTVLALAQVVLFVVAGALTLAVTGERELLGLIGPAMIWYVLFFVIGFVALSSLWAVAGSLASRQQDLQATTMPGQVLLFVPYLLAVLAGEGVKTVFSMVPIASAMLMPVRIAEGSVPAWQIAVAVLANVVATVLLVRAGAKIYERTLLRTDQRIKFADALRISG